MKPQEGEVLEACGTNMGAFTYVGSGQSQLDRLRD